MTEAWEAAQMLVVSVAEVCRSDEKKSVAAGMRHRMAWWGKHTKKSRRSCGEWLPCGTTLACLTQCDCEVAILAC